MTQIAAPGNYAFSDLPDGTYYIASVIIACGDDCPLQPTDPWGVYDGCGGIASVTVSGGNSIADIDVTLVDGTLGAPNPFYEQYNAEARSRHHESGGYRNRWGRVLCAVRVVAGNLCHRR